MEKAVVAVGFDPKKLPLGSLSDETVKEGYKYLREIDAVLNENSLTKKGVFTNDQRNFLFQLSAKFYTYIPHNFGR